VAGVLTTSSTVDCGHGGAVSVSGESKLKVAGSPVLLKAGIDSKPVAATCLLQDTSDSSGPLTIKCKTVTSVTAGEATKLKVSGSPVMLDTLAGGTDGMATKGTLATALRATAGQTKMKAS
jgi:hypothetical protein